MKTARIIFVILISFKGFAVLAQDKEHNKEVEQLLEFSRPASMHQVLQRLAGSWNFQDAKLAFVKCTLTRTSRYDNRLFDVEITRGKSQLPVVVGMKEDNYHSLQLKGFDNVRTLFVTILVNNYLGSDIQEQTGHYDLAKSQLIYEWDSELLP